MTSPPPAPGSSVIPAVLIPAVLIPAVQIPAVQIPAAQIRQRGRHRRADRAGRYAAAQRGSTRAAVPGRPGGAAVGTGRGAGRGVGLRSVAAYAREQADMITEARSGHLLRRDATTARLIARRRHRTEPAAAYQGLGRRQDPRPALTARAWTSKPTPRRRGGW